MICRNILLALLGASILVTPLEAQSRGGSAGPHGGGPGALHGAGVGGSPHGMTGGTGSFRGRSVFTGGPRGSVGWNAFHHDTAPARVAPHRLSGTNLPKPNAWRGNAHDFDLTSWQGGGWQHISHNGRMGWWWVVGPDWYFFDEPVYPYPDLYTPVGEPIGWWYWCDSATEYYPYVTYCPVAWEAVMPMD